MIAYPIGCPIGLRRVYPNRPRIAQPNPTQPVPVLVGHLAFFTHHGHGEAMR